MTHGMVIAGRRIGVGAPLFVVAEIGLNHEGHVERALSMVDAAARSGVSAIKLQTLDADRLVAPSCPAPMHVHAASLADFFSRFELDGEAHRRVARNEKAVPSAEMPWTRAPLVHRPPARDRERVPHGLAELTIEQLP